MRRAGFTILELVISSAMVLLILGLSLAMFLSAVRALRAGERRSSVQRSALLLIQRLRQEVGCAYRDSLRLESQELTFLSDRGNDGSLRFSPTGQRLWLRWLRIGWLDSGKVVVSEWSIPNPTCPPHLSPPGATANGWNHRTISNDVERLNFQTDAQGSLHLQLATAREGLRYEVNTVLPMPLDGG